MFRRARHQRGSLKRIRCKSGQIVWVFRWYETQFDGRKKYRKVVIGSGEDFETEAAAQLAADALSLTINQLTPRQLLRAISFETSVQHYRQHEMPNIFFKGRKDMLRVVEEEGKKSCATQETYEGCLNKWNLPRWLSSRLGDMKAVRVEERLHSLLLARGSKAKIRNIMSASYSHAIRWEFASHNPITAVRQSAKRSKIPTILTVQEIQALLKHLEDPCRIMVLLGVSTGLRVGELLGLKWIEVDFEKLQINITRSVVKQKIGPCKTEASHKPIPLDSELVEQLRRWRHKTPYSRPNDWMFASPHKRGTQPYWPGSVYRARLQPALKAAGICREVGWHTLRHTFGTLMKANGEDIKTIQELLRHANYKVTADIYTQAMTPVKRRAQTRIVRLILPLKTSAEVSQP